MKKYYFILLCYFCLQYTNAQKCIISAAANNIVYRGMASPIDIMVEGIKCKNILVKVDNGKIEKSENCLFIYSPSEKKEVEISVFKIKKKDTILVGKQKFRIKNVEIEIVFKNKFNQTLKYYNDSIFKDTLRNFEKLIAQVNMPYGIVCGVTLIVLSYTVLIVRGNEVIYNKRFNTNMINSELQTILSDLENGDFISFNQIQTNKKGFDNNSFIFILK